MMKRENWLGRRIGRQSPLCSESAGLRKSRGANFDNCEEAACPLSKVMRKLPNNDVDTRRALRLLLKSNVNLALDELPFPRGAQAADKVLERLLVGLAIFEPRHEIEGFA